MMGFPLLMDNLTLHLEELKWMVEVISVEVNTQIKYSEEISSMKLTKKMIIFKTWTEVNLRMQEQE
jgi:hypothetical protein